MIKPLHNRIVVERIDADEKTSSGLIIPDSAKEKPQQGKVMAVGPGGKNKEGKLIPMDVAVGDHILFAKYGGAEVTLEGQDYLMLKDDDVLAVFQSSAKRKKAL